MAVEFTLRKKKTDSALFDDLYILNEAGNEGVS